MRLNFTNIYKETFFWVGVTGAFVVAVVFFLPFVYQLLTHVGHDLKVNQYKVKIDIEDISGQIEKYQKHKSSLPKNLEVLVAPPEIKNHEPWHFNKLPNDPWGTPYQYNIENVNGSEAYKVWTFGKDGKYGGKGENMDLSNSTDWKTVLD